MDEDGIRPALSPEEWKLDFFQRGALGAVWLPGGGLSLIEHAADGEPTAVTLDGEQRHALAALALRDQPFGFTWQDYEDEVIVAALLRSYQRGVPFWELKESLRLMLDDLLERRISLASRIAALLPPPADGSVDQPS